MNKDPIGVCPHLGWYVDPETHHAYPSAANQCHTQYPPLTIELSHQSGYCLKGKWSACPRYRAAQSGSGLDEPIPMPVPGGPGGSRRLTSWAVVGGALVLVLILAGLFLVLSRRVGLGSPSTPDGGVSMTESTATVQLAPTDEVRLAASETSPPVPSSTPGPTSSATLPPLAGATGTRLPGEWTSPTPTPTPTLDLPPSPTPSITPTPSQTPTPVPTTTPTPSLTPTRKPTPTPTTTLTPTLTPKPTAKPTRRPPTPTPLPAPVLRSPAEGHVYSFRDEVILEWEPVGQLAQDEYYVPTVAWQRWGSPTFDETPWVKDTRWVMSEHDWLLAYSDDGEFRWSVQVMRRTGTDDKGRPVGTPRGPMSDVRTLFWNRKGDSGGGPPPP